MNVNRAVSTACEQPQGSMFHRTTGSVMIGVMGLAAAATLLLGLVPQGNASSEVLSDMDCVIEPSRVIELGSAVPGLLAESIYDRSDFVSEGTLMARLESDVERITLAIATQSSNSLTAVQLRELSAEFGDRTRRRNAKLLKSSGVSKQAMDQVTTESQIAQLQLLQEQESVRLAQLEVSRAQALLDRREIRSPIAGSVTRRYKSSGEYVDSEPVYQIAQLDPLHVEVIVPIDYLGSLETGMTAAIQIDVPGFQGKTLEATVRRIDAVADAASATYGVRLLLDNPDLTVPSGVRCQVDFFAS